MLDKHVAELEEANNLLQRCAAQQQSVEACQQELGECQRQQLQLQERCDQVQNICSCLTHLSQPSTRHVLDHVRCRWLRMAYLQHTSLVVSVSAHIFNTHLHYALCLMSGSNETVH